MKLILILALSTGIAAWAVPAGAESHGQHQEHGKSAEDCMAMQKMDKNKMDMNDPAMKAMHERCMAQMHDAGHGSGADGHDHSAGQDGKTEIAPAQPEHNHEKSGN